MYVFIWLAVDVTTWSCYNVTIKSYDHPVAREEVWVEVPKQTFVNLDKDKREIIIQAALEEFSQQSYNAASVNRIVEKSGISKGSLYQYFQDKKDLYLYLLENSSQVKLDFLLAREQEMVFDDFFQGLATLMLLGSEFDLNNPLHSKLLSSAFNGPLVDESLLKMKEMSRQYMVHLLENAKNSGQVRDDVDTDLMVFFVNALTADFAKFVASKAGLDYFGEIFESQNIERIKKLDLSGIINELMKLVQGGLSPVGN